MVTRIKPKTLSIAASTTSFTDIGSLTVPEGHKYKIVEINPLVAADCQVNVMVENDTMAEFPYDLVALDPRRRVVDWELPAGATLYIKGTNEDGSAHVIGVELTFEDTA